MTGDIYTELDTNSNTHRSEYVDLGKCFFEGCGGVVWSLGGLIVVHDGFGCNDCCFLFFIVAMMRHLAASLFGAILD